MLGKLATNIPTVCPVAPPRPYLVTVHASFLQIHLGPPPLRHIRAFSTNTTASCRRHRRIGRSSQLTNVPIYRSG
ncbi:hypothetical protein PgNI_05568 [Pyricularia grisea]|uniref:Uncharacterized protein n=1 Tax=Pyricularia grisea TaxID=148305 RepID=A0A6P8B6Q4_PYRGI|nr:hypothetical protein PgNI_05568 [Pyricularia grisea]TLD10997.1 hypothetical protein PgNI_05568 [Pyricularia grisea]